jgi:hypothetical protein
LKLRGRSSVVGADSTDWDERDCPVDLYVDTVLACIGLKWSDLPTLRIKHLWDVPVVAVMMAVIVARMGGQSKRCEHGSNQNRAHGVSRQYARSAITWPPGKSKE